MYYNQNMYYNFEKETLLFFTLTACLYIHSMVEESGWCVRNLATPALCPDKYAILELGACPRKNATLRMRYSCEVAWVGPAGQNRKKKTSYILSPALPIHLFFGTPIHLLSDTLLCV